MKRAAVSLRSLRRSAREAAGTVSKGREPKPAWGPGSQPFETPEAPSAPGLLRERVGAPEVPSVPGLLRERGGTPEVPSVPPRAPRDVGGGRRGAARPTRARPAFLQIGSRPPEGPETPPGGTATAHPTRPGSCPAAVDLLHHGDRDLAPGLVDLAVNVRSPPTPTWLAAEIFGDGNLAAYPDPAPRPRRHRRPPRRRPRHGAAGRRRRRGVHPHRPRPPRRRADRPPAVHRARGGAAGRRPRPPPPPAPRPTPASGSSPPRCRRRT